MASTSQNRRNAVSQAVTPATPVAAPVLDLDTLLASLESAEWAPPTLDKASEPAGTAPIIWGDKVKLLADKAKVILPEYQPKKPGVAGFRHTIAHAPKDLTMLNSLIPATVKKRNPANLLLVSLINGSFHTANGIIPIPSLAMGQPLPIIVLLQCLAQVPQIVEDNAYLKKLYDRGPGCIIANIATKAGRYCYLDGENLMLADCLSD